MSLKPLLFLILFSRILFSAEVPTQTFGGYMHQTLTTIGTPNKANLSTGHYHFKAGWLEPLSFSKEQTDKCAYLSSTVKLDASFLHSNYSALFYIGFLKWIEAGIGYQKVLYHKSLLSYEEKEEPAQWTPKEALANIRDNKGELSDADVFLYTLNLSIPTPFLIANASIQRERWDINTGNNSYAYDFHNGLLVKSQEDYTYIMGELHFLPKLTFSPTIRNTYTNVEESGYHINQSFIGLKSIPLYKDRGLYMNTYIGNWTHHPQVEAWSWESMIFSLDLIWEVQLIH